MKSLQPILLVLLLLIAITSFFQCSSHNSKTTSKVKNQVEFQENLPIAITEVNFQNWASGLQEGGSGIHINIITTNTNTHVVLDSIYFRGLTAKIEPNKMNYFARLSRSNTTNALSHQPKSDNKFPFDLKENECIISYRLNRKIYYYKVDNLVEKQAQYYPKAPKDN